MSSEHHFVQLLVLRQIVENKQVYMSKAEGKELIALLASLHTAELTADDLVYANPWILAMGMGFRFNVYYFIVALNAEIESQFMLLKTMYKTVDYKILIDGSVYYYLDTNGVSLRGCSTINRAQRV